MNQQYLENLENKSFPIMKLEKTTFIDNKSDIVNTAITLNLRTSDSDFF